MKRFKCGFRYSPMCRATNSARHLEDQVTPILCVLLSPWEQRFRKLESSWGGAAHSPHKHPQNVYIQHLPLRPPPPYSPSPSSPPFFFTLLMSVLWARCSSSPAPALCRALLCALRSVLRVWREKRKKKREGGKERETEPLLSHPPSPPPSIPPLYRFSHKIISFILSCKDTFGLLFNKSKFAFRRKWNKLSK